MGTAWMGADHTRAVTSPFGMVHDADRLMVADASLFPIPIGSTPMETIMALATCGVDYVIGNVARFCHNGLPGATARPADQLRGVLSTISSVTASDTGLTRWRSKPASNARRTS